MEICAMQHAEQILLKYADGESSTLTFFPSLADPKHIAFIIFPAMGVKGSYYKTTAEFLTKRGYHTVILDHRGHGTSSVFPSRGADFGYREQIEIEYPLMLQSVKERFTKCKVIPIGHSLGGQMGSMFISRYPEMVDGFILNASCSPYYKGWGAVLGGGFYVFTRLILVLSKILGYYPGNRTGFGGREAKTLINDWSRSVFTNHFSAVGSAFNYEQAMQQSKIPVLGLTYKGDSSAPPAALRNLTAKFRSSKIELHHIKPQDGTKKFNHYSWAKNPSICIGIIEEWVTDFLLTE